MTAPKLFGFELAWADAAFDAILPDGTSLPHGIARLHPGRFLAGLVAAAPLEQSIGLRLMLWTVALAPLWILHRPTTIAGIGADERKRVLDRLIASPVYAVRQLAIAFKATASMLYAQSPDARRAMTRRADDRAQPLVRLSARRAGPTRPTGPTRPKDVDAAE